MKRARTTGYYLAAATVGTDADRALVRREIDKVHTRIRSSATSPVRYNAFDPRLQLWVALYGPLTEDAADAVYQDAKKLGTMLQVREDMWPADRAALDAYWKRSLADLRIDPPVREHLYGVAATEFLPTPLRQLIGPLNLFATTGFLPPEFRTQMQLR